MYCRWYDNYLCGWSFSILTTIPVGLQAARVDKGTIMHLIYIEKTMCLEPRTPPPDRAAEGTEGLEAGQGERIGARARICPG